MLKNIFLYIYIVFQEMPWLLRLLSVVCLIFGAFAVAVIVPFPKGSYWLNGKTVTYEQFKASGGVLFFFINSIPTLIAGIGLILRKTWSRLIILLLLPMQIAVAFVLGLENWAGVKGGLIGVLIITPLLFWYLFSKRRVKEYFGVQSPTSNKGNK